MKKINVVHSSLNEHAIADANLQTWYAEIEDGDTVHFATSLQLNELRIGVRFNEVEPFSFSYNGSDIHVGKKGDLSDWPKGFAEHQKDQVFALIKGDISKYRTSEKIGDLSNWPMAITLTSKEVTAVSGDDIHNPALNKI
jgi:hypothetical protein